MALEMRSTCEICATGFTPGGRAPGRVDSGEAGPLPLFAYLIRPTRTDMLAAGPTPAEADVVRRHYEYLRGLATAGTVILAARTLTTDESNFGTVVLHAHDEAAARVLLERDPAVAGRVMRSELFPYRTALWGEFDRATI